MLPCLSSSLNAATAPLPPSLSVMTAAMYPHAWANWPAFQRHRARTWRSISGGLGGGRHDSECSGLWARMWASNNSCISSNRGTHVFYINFILLCACHTHITLNGKNWNRDFSSRQVLKYYSQNYIFLLNLIPKCRMEPAFSLLTSRDGRPALNTLPSCYCLGIYPSPLCYWPPPTYLPPHLLATLRPSLPSSGISWPVWS